MICIDCGQPSQIIATEEGGGGGLLPLCEACFQARLDDLIDGACDNPSGDIAFVAPGTSPGN